MPSNKPNIRPALIQPEDLLDRLYKAWLTDKIELLPEQEQKILERMDYADAKIKAGGTGSMYRILVQDMMQKFKAHKVTKRTIENDIARAKRFFQTARPREDKEYARGMSIEWLQRLIWKAEAADDFRAAALFIRELDEIQGFKKEDPERPNYESVQPAPIIVVTDPVQLGVPDIPNLEEEIRILNLPKAAAMKFESEDIDDAEVLDE